MKILISNDGPHAHFYIRTGIGRALTYAGHQVVMWEISKKAAFDAFDEFEPDMFIGQTYNLNEAVRKCILARPNMKVIMKGSDWGAISDSIDRVKYPVLIANEQEIENVAELRKNGKPDLLYVHYHPDRLGETHNHWDDIVQTVSLMNAADIFLFTNGKVKDQYKSHVGFMGGRWGYKAQTIDKYLLPLMNPKSRLNIKIFGNSDWGVPQYCGFLPDNEAAHFLRSCDICPNLSEPHSHKYGYDVVERPFKLLANKCFVISDYVEDLEKLFPKSIIHCKTPAEFHEKIGYYLDKPKERAILSQLGYEEVIGGHTYFHRMASIFGELGMGDEQENMLKSLDKCIKELKL